VGLERLKVFHGNDSKRPCGSRIDRHEHIGEGCIGLEPFRRLLTDFRFAGLPMLIETEKTHGAEKRGAILADPLDVKNLETLRRLRDAKPGADVPDGGANLSDGGADLSGPRFH
jgi:deoxyribonuclease-4